MHVSHRNYVGKYDGSSSTLQPHGLITLDLIAPFPVSSAFLFSSGIDLRRMGSPLEYGSSLASGLLKEGLDPGSLPYVYAWTP